MPKLTIFARATRIPDGDGFTAVAGGVLWNCRLAWLDAPEMSQPYGPEARATLYHLIHNQELRISALSHDKYGRMIVSVHNENREHVNEVLIRLGAAHYMPKYGLGPASLAAAASWAKTMRQGLWASPHPILPVDHRQAAKAILGYKQTIQNRRASHG